MLKKITIALVPVLFSSNVFAAQVFQTLAPGAGQSEVTPRLGLAAVGAETKSTPKTTLSAGLLNLGVSYFYGLAEGQSLGAEVSYSSQTQKASTSGFADQNAKRKGLLNPFIMYKGLFETGSVSIFTQVGYQFGIEKAKYNYTDSEGNQADGQNKILINVGAYAPLNPEITMGGFIKFEKANDGESTETTGGVDSINKLSGGNSTYVAAFFELPSNEYKPNASLGYRVDNSTESVSGGIPTKSDELRYLILTGSAQFPIQPNISFNPEIIYQSLLSNDRFDRYGVIAASAKLRILF